MAVTDPGGWPPVPASAQECLREGRPWRYGLLVDVGSTFSKVCVVDPRGRFLEHAHAPTTIDGNVVDGVRDAVAQLTPARRKALDWALVCSSAAGGLRMASIGLTAALSGRAGTLAALGAGAKVVATRSGFLDDDDVAAVSAARPHLILLSGGLDGGNAEALLHNARRLAGLGSVAGIILAGNRDAAAAAEAALRGPGRDVRVDVRVVDNVFPRPGEVDLGPTRDAVRDLFMRHITRAKGLQTLLADLRSDCEPTPLAVSRALWDLPGTAAEPVVLVDVGGATTDVHSVGGRTYHPRAVDLPVPEVMRTVEGDLGMRFGATGVVATMGADQRRRAELRLDRDLAAEAERRHEDPGFLPRTPVDHAVDEVLARSAIAVALERHAGRVVVRKQPWGDRYRVSGKDLRSCRRLVVTGGVFRHLGDPAATVAAALCAVDGSLVPKTPAVTVDTHYGLYAIGLVARLDRDLAAAMVRHLLPPPPGKENRDDLGDEPHAAAP